MRRIAILAGMALVAMTAAASTCVWGGDAAQATDTTAPPAADDSQPLDPLSASPLSIAPTWTHLADVVGGRSNDDVAAGGARTVYTTGFVRQGESGGLHLAKYVDGRLRWQRTAGASGHGATGVAIEVRGGAIYTAGIRYGGSGPTGALLLIRWDASGKRVWSRTYGSSGRRSYWPTDMALDGAGNVTVVALSTVGDPFAEADVSLISYRSTGALRFVRHYDGPAHRADWPYDMVLDSAGSAYIAGTSASGTGEDALLLKYSRTGARLWARRFNGAVGGDDRLYALRLRPGGGVYATGYTTGGHTAQNGLLLAYTGAGKRLFVTEEMGGGDETFSQVFADLEVLPSGDIVCGGWEEGATPDRFYAIYSRSGKLREKVTETDPGSGRIVAMARDAQGGILLTGKSGTAEYGQVCTERICAGGMNWTSTWPASAQTSYEAHSIAVSGVNVYVAGTFGSSGYPGALVLGYVY